MLFFFSKNQPKVYAAFPFSLGTRCKYQVSVMTSGCRCLSMVWDCGISIMHYLFRIHEDWKTLTKINRSVLRLNIHI